MYPAMQHKAALPGRVSPPRNNIPIRARCRITGLACRGSDSSLFLHEPARTSPPGPAGRQREPPPIAPLAPSPDIYLKLPAKSRYRTAFPRRQTGGACFQLPRTTIYSQPSAEWRSRIEFNHRRPAAKNLSLPPRRRSTGFAVWMKQFCLPATEQLSDFRFVRADPDWIGIRSL